MGAKRKTVKRKPPEIRVRVEDPDLAVRLGYIAENAQLVADALADGVELGELGLDALRCVVDDAAQVALEHARLEDAYAMEENRRRLNQRWARKSRAEVKRRAKR